MQENGNKGFENNLVGGDVKKTDSVDDADGASGELSSSNLVGEDVKKTESVGDAQDGSGVFSSPTNNHNGENLEAPMKGTENSSMLFDKSLTGAQESVAVRREETLKSFHRLNKSSLDLRRLPVDFEKIFSLDAETCMGRGVSAVWEFLEDPEESVTVGFFRSLCLNSNFTLRKQLMYIFGSSSSFGILLVVVASIVITILSGRGVREIGKQSFSDLATEHEVKSARYLSETLGPKLIPEDLVSILHDALQDRFVGYPDYPGYIKDELVPFLDMDSKSRKYPIVGDQLPLDWQIVPNVNDENYMEHVQNRWRWYQGDRISTTSPAFYMQGMCDPSVTDPTMRSYYENCTDENNNIKTGGVVAPTSTNLQIYRKASDLTPLLKALYESRQEIRSLGFYFANSGSGASIQFPHVELDTNVFYDSSGCDWLFETPNPYKPSQTILEGTASREHVRSICHPNGTSVPTRIYNPMERSFCIDQAQNPLKVRVHGPYRDAFRENIRYVTVGRAVYDKVTSEFIACIAVDFVLDSLRAILEQSAEITFKSQVSIVRYDKVGTVVASTAWDPIESSLTTVTIDEISAGVSKTVYEALWSLVDYSSYGDDDAVWNATLIRQIYEDFVHRDFDDEYNVVGYPIPPPPDDYDPAYLPEFMAIVAVANADIYGNVDIVVAKVNNQIMQVEIVALVVGAVGLGIALLLVILISRGLTSPLRYMNDVASDIFEKNFGADHDKDLCDEGSQGAEKNTTRDSQHDTKVEFKPPKCSVRTEIDDVVKEFEKMVSQFSGRTQAISMKAAVSEFKNEFPINNEFKKLYLSRETGFKYDFKYKAPSHSLRRLNFGPITKDDNALRESTVTDVPETAKSGKCSSKLFLWVVILMILPFLLTTITISLVVIYVASTEFEQLANEVTEIFIDAEKQALTVYVGHRAALAQAIMEQPVRDLFILTRYAGWILFDGVRRRNSFTEIKSVAQVTSYEDMCECAWDDVHQTCFDMSTMDHRYSLIPYFATQSQDTWPNGDRNFTSIPEVVSWWADASTLPGWELGSFALDLSSTYSRLRKLSALPLFQIIQGKNMVESQKMLRSAGIGIEADGTFFGYGCKIPTRERVSSFVVTSSEIAEFRPDICPLGKHGFDPRCRDWYNIGKNLFEKNKTYLYVTPPYNGVGRSVQTCTSPLADKEEYMGQVAVDFSIAPLLDSLSRQRTLLWEGGFPILITTYLDNSVNDTVIGPDFNSSYPQPIEKVVFKNEPDCNVEQGCPGWQMFGRIVDEMKAGKSGIEEFTRTTRDGSMDHIYISYAPVKVRNFYALDNSDFSQGVNISEHAVYSIALAETQEDILKEFDRVYDKLYDVVLSAFFSLIAIICLTSICFVWISYRVALSITEPMIYLLELIRQINDMDNCESAPDIDADRRGHSREVVNVAKTMESLYHVVRSANIAFFTGEIGEAYSVLARTLKLYRRLDNKKGIGIACNNLGNMMLTMFRMMEKQEENICDLTRRDIVAKGIRYFHESIQLGEKAYDAFYEAQGWSPSCLEFMQHLSNRYFNRAVFLLTVKDFHENPQEIEELGLRDLEIARDMDLEIIEEGTQAGWGVRTSDRLFDIALCRIRGHLLLQRMGYPDDWEVDEMLDNIFKTLKGELRKPDDSNLFQDMTPSGRMQQVEIELMKYKLLKNDLPTAAKIAIRILVEDEYAIAEALGMAVKVLLKYIRSSEFQAEEMVTNNIEQELRQYQEADNKTVMNSVDKQPSIKKSSRQKSEKDMSTSQLQWSYSFKESNRGDFTMEAF